MSPEVHAVLAVATFVAGLVGGVLLDRALLREQRARLREDFRRLAAAQARVDLTAHRLSVLQWIALRRQERRALRTAR